MTDSKVFVPSLGSGVAIANQLVTTGAGPVYRQETVPFALDGSALASEATV